MTEHYCRQSKELLLCVPSQLKNEFSSWKLTAELATTVPEHVPHCQRCNLEQLAIKDCSVLHLADTSSVASDAKPEIITLHLKFYPTYIVSI